MGLVSGHGESDIRGLHSFFVAGGGETVDEAAGWDLLMGRGQERSEGGNDS